MTRTVKYPAKNNVAGYNVKWLEYLVKITEKWWQDNMASGRNIIKCSKDIIWHDSMANGRKIGITCKNLNGK